MNCLSPWVDDGPRETKLWLVTFGKEKSFSTKDSDFGLVSTRWNTSNQDCGTVFVFAVNTCANPVPKMRKPGNNFPVNERFDPLLNK
jgi:hypothetical protein